MLEYYQHLPVAVTFCRRCAEPWRLGKFPLLLHRQRKAPKPRLWAIPATQASQQRMPPKAVFSVVSWFCGQVAKGVVASSRPGVT